MRYPTVAMSHRESVWWDYSSLALSVSISPNALKAVRLFSGVTDSVSHEHGDSESMSHKHGCKEITTIFDRQQPVCLGNV